MSQVAVKTDTSATDNKQILALPYKEKHGQDSDMKCDYLPDEILLTITQHNSSSRPSVLAPPVKLKSKQGKPANVWNFPEQREKLRHLTQSSACICGAGKDISFLYDIPAPEGVKLKPAAVPDPSAMRMRSRDLRRSNKSEFNLPDTLVPDEFHLVKSKGVIGLEYHEGEFSTNPVDHEKHLTVFPSLKPTSRFEVLKLKETMESMLKKAGVDEFDDLGKSPSQMHALLSLVKKEQDIYNVIFHELIRQTTVECIERGELLATLRQRYSNLLSKIPEQVKSLHNEVVAQRALDRRLTEELLRFKTTISVLTNELSEVKKHEENVSQEIQMSKKEMKQALEDAKRNADLLNEYHSLYELQRHRLEDQVGQLSEEREMWSTAAYCLAMKVTEEYRLITASRLHVAEKSWSELARHFTVLLTDVDTTSLTELQGLTNEWRDYAEQFSAQLQQREKQTLKTMEILKGQIKQFMENFEDEYLSEQGHLLQVPEIGDVFQTIYKWEKMLSTEAESFGGDVMLSMQDNLSKMRRLVMRWTDAAIKIFQRHAPSTPNPALAERNSSTVMSDGQEAASSLPNVQEMYAMNKGVEELMRQFNTRLTGDNGVAQSVLTLQSILESWHTRLAAVIHNQNKPFPDTEWSRLYAMLPDWIQMLDETKVFVGRVDREEDMKAGVKLEVVDVTATLIETQKWASVTSSNIDSENGRLMARATQLHTEMIHWMIQVLLRVAPSHPSSTPEGRMNGLLASASVGELKQIGMSLFERVDEFTSSLSSACSLIVSEITQAKTDLHEEDADVEANEMRRFQTESKEWINTAKILLNELLTGEVAMEPRSVPSSAPSILAVNEGVMREASELDFNATPKSRSMVRQEKSSMDRTDEYRNVEGISTDSNTHTRALVQGEQAPPMPLDEGMAELQQLIDTPNTERAYVALAAVKNLQNQLRLTEERAEIAETDAMQARLQVAASEEMVKSLEQKLASLQRDMETLMQEQKDQDPLPNLLFRPSSQPASSGSPTTNNGENGKAKSPASDSQKSSNQKGGRKAGR